MTPPYYIVPAVEEYRKLDPDSEEAKKLSRIIAANIGDYASLRLILGIDPPEFARFYPDMENNTPTTLDTIDSFLEKFGANLPENPMPEESMAYVLEEEPEREPDLKTLMKEQRYEEALKFIEAQNLINPQKSVYFALQIRFIKKLMALKSYKNKTKG